MFRLVEDARVWRVQQPSIEFHGHRIQKLSSTVEWGTDDSPSVATPREIQLNPSIREQMPDSIRLEINIEIWKDVVDSHTGIEAVNSGAKDPNDWDTVCGLLCNEGTLGVNRTLGLTATEPAVESLR